jgi:hypothetical protein
MQEKKKQDEGTVERLIQKTKVPQEAMTKHEDELKQIIKEYKIDIKNMKLPYYMKIKQICA